MRQSKTTPSCWSAVAQTPRTEGLGAAALQPGASMGREPPSARGNENQYQIPAKAPRQCPPCEEASRRSARRRPILFVNLTYQKINVYVYWYDCYVKRAKTLAIKPGVPIHSKHKQPHINQLRELCYNKLNFRTITFQAQDDRATRAQHQVKV